MATRNGAEDSSAPYRLDGARRIVAHTMGKTPHPFGSSEM
jgi:hypothetical protein